jgi:hypothetical protein
MRILLIIIITFNHVHSTFAQYNITSNAKCIAALKNKSMNGDQLLVTTSHFFEYPRIGNHYKWLGLLSAECFVNGVPAEVTNVWWNFLSNSSIKYEILGQAPEIKTNQKYIYYKLWSRNGYEGEKRLVLIQENGNWKVNSIDL